MDALQARNRIVLATYGSPGDLYPFLAIGAELRNRGGDVVVATSERYRGLVLAAGLGFAAVRPDRSAAPREPDVLERLTRGNERPRQVFRAMFLPALRESLADLLDVIRGAGIVVSHTLTAAAPLAAEAYGVPWVSTVMQPMGYFSAHEPPIVGPTWVSAALRSMGPGAARPVLRAVRALTGAWADEWHELRAELGLHPADVHPLFEGQHSPRRSLGLFPRPLGEPLPDWPAQARVTGFPYYRAPDASLDPVIEWFLGAGEPPIVFTLGTTAVNDPGGFFEESAAAAERLGKRALLLVGGGPAPVNAAASDRVLAAPYAPHHLVFPRAAAIVHQGGIGTLAEGLLAGKPMLIVPHAHDQFDNAWRAQRLGVALTFSRRRFRGSAVRRALLRCLDDQKLAQTAKALSRVVEREHGARAAADAIDDVRFRRIQAEMGERQGVRTSPSERLW